MFSVQNFGAEVLRQLRMDNNWNIDKKRLNDMVNKQRRERLSDEAQAAQLECQKNYISCYTAQGAFNHSSCLNDCIAD